jgi:hypothetical protein
MAPGAAIGTASTWHCVVSDAGSPYTDYTHEYARGTTPLGYGARTAARRASIPPN